MISLAEFCCWFCCSRRLRFDAEVPPLKDRMSDAVQGSELHFPVRATSYKIFLSSGGRKREVVCGFMIGGCVVLSQPVVVFVQCK